MAGLLDFFGNGWDDPKSNAVMALAGGLLDGDFAGGMKGYAGVMAGAPDVKLKRAMQQAQMDKYAADTDMDRQKLSLSQAKEKRDSEFETTFLNRLRQVQGGGGVATPNMPVTGSGGSMPQGGGGLGGVPSGGQSFGGDPFAGVDPMAMLLDWRNNQGKNMGGWVNDATKPQKREQGSTYIDPRTGVERVFPKVADGMIPNAQGVYGFAPGYAEAQAQFEGAKTRAIEDAKAGYSLQEKTLAGGQPVVGTTSQLINAVNQGGNPFLPKGESPARMPSGNSEAQIIANGMGGLNGLPTVARGGNVSFKSTPQEMDKPRILQDAFADASARFEAAQKVGDTANMRRAQSDVESIRSEFSKIGRPQSLAPNQAPNTAPQSAPSFGLQLQSLSDKERISAENDAYKAKLVDTAKADVVRDTTDKGDVKRVNKFEKLSSEARNLLASNPTASGLGALTDSSLSFLGQSTKGGDAASALRTLSSKMTMEVPRMEGPQSDADRKSYEAAAGLVGDATKPISQRIAALNTIDKINAQYADLNGGSKPKQEQKTLQDYGYKSPDDVLRDARNTLMRNPQARGEVEKRLKAMGLSLGGQ